MHKNRILGVVFGFLAVAALGATIFIDSSLRQLPLGEAVYQMPLPYSPESSPVAECEKIAYEDSKNNCYYGYALAKKDLSLCERVGDKLIAQCVRAISPAPPVKVYQPGADPQVISVNSKTPVKFCVSYSGTEDVPDKAYITELLKSTGEITMTSERHLFAWLNDDGVDGDLVAGDRSYCGTVKDVGPYTVDTKVNFRAEFEFGTTTGAHGYLSPVTSVYVTRFPPGLAMSNTIVTGKDGEKLVGNQVLVGFKNIDIHPERVEAIAKSVNGKVASAALMSLGTYVIEIPYTKDGSGVYQAIRTLKSFPEVASADPNGISETF